ncbi:MAG TPA: flagellar hook-basal body complex protein [Pseudolabrys sp.]|nr:flagellar hook-basal body complex protein [Pseudolabrys sp.]
MGLFDALTNAVSGLQSQAYAMQNISGNIANSQTISYKGLNTNFQDLIPDSNSVASQQVGSGVYASSLATVTVQGAIQATQSGTNIAVNGDGFFTVQNPTSFTGTTPNFNGVVSYTRRGDFELNANGYMVNGGGYYLEGIPIDQTTGAPSGNVPSPLQFNNNLLPASPTTQIDYGINLPSTPATQAYNPAIPNSELLNLAGFTQNPTLNAGSNTHAIATGTSALGTINLTAQGATSASITEGAFTTVDVSGGGDAVNFTLNVDGTAHAVSITAANVTAYNTANSTALSAAALSAQDVANIINFQVGSNVTTVSGGNLVFTSPTTGAASSLTITAASETTTSGSTGVANHAIVNGANATNLTFNVNGQTVTLAGGSSYNPTAIKNAINAQVGVSAQVNATINSAGDLVLTSTNTAGATDTVTVNTFSSGDATQLGFAGATVSVNGANGLPSTGQVIGTDAPNFINESIDGGSATVYDAAGTPANLQLRWTKVDSVAAGGANTWELFYQTDPNAVGNQVAWQNAGTDFTFNSAGQLVAGSASITLNNVTVGSTNLGNLTLITPVGSITQFANTSGQPTINQIQANGFPAGQLQSVSVGSNGLISGIFSNGRNVNLAQIPLVHFNAENQLQSLTGGAYQATTDSGQAIAGASGKIVGQSLESSNVDIATEFTKLIVTQQAYSANTKVITTANQMSQDLLNVIR